MPVPEHIVVQGIRWKVYFEGALGKKFVKPEEHRALSDIMGSIEELKYYLTFMKKEVK